MKWQALLAYLVYYVASGIGCEAHGASGAEGIQSLSLAREYELLGVSAEDSIGAIKKAHRKLSLANHPDKQAGCADCASKLADINAAYDRIVYLRRRTDSPGLEMFFGFSEKLFNLISEVSTAWDKYPEKQRLFGLWSAYRESESLDKDLAHLGVIAGQVVQGILDTNANEIALVLGLLVVWNVSALVGIVTICYCIFKVCWWTWLLVYFPISWLFTYARAGSPSSPGVKSPPRKAKSSPLTTPPSSPSSSSS